MLKEITSGIQVSVETKYRSRQSNPHNLLFVFAYKIVIKNTNDFSIQLLRREWHIWDSIGTTRTIEGEGVIGKQPILASGETFEYESFCDLATNIGKMSGSYQMENKNTKEKFSVTIPEFEMVVPFKMN